MSQLGLFEGPDPDKNVRNEARHMIHERRQYEDGARERAAFVEYGAAVDAEHGRMIARDLIRGASAFDDIIKDLDRGRYSATLALSLLEEAPARFDRLESI